MAPIRRFCRQCKAKTSDLRSGWQMESGDCFLLCQKCSSAYEEGRFCHDFHQDQNGWKPCILCGKELHSACAASCHLMVPFDNGDVACIDCCKDSGEMVELDTAQPQAYSRIPKEGESSNRATRKRKSSAIFSRAVRPPQRRQCEEQSSEELRGKGVRSGVEEIVEIDPPANPVARIIIPYNNWPKISDENLERIPRNYNSFIVPLFEKRLNHEDASTELGRILLPKICAEAYFPRVTGPHGVFIHAHDMEGREHLLNYHVSTYHGVKDYSLTGLEDYMQAMHVEAGDTVTFCCMQPEGTLVLVRRKASAAKPSYKEPPQYPIKLEFLNSRNGSSPTDSSPELQQLEGGI